MSRRVFDGRLDILRMKSTLKARAESQRDKALKSSPSSEIDANDERSQQQVTDNAITPRLSSKKSNPTVQTFDSRDILPLADTIVLPPSGPPTPTQIQYRDKYLPPLPGTTQPEGLASPTAQVELLHTPLPSQTPMGLQTLLHTPMDPTQNFDLAAPPPREPISTLDGVSELLFGGDHLRVILQDPSLFLKFTAFLNRYKPRSAPKLVQYLQTQKAMKAVQYANFVAETIQPLPGEYPGTIPCSAAMLDTGFEARSRKAFESLVNDALPAYITYLLVQVVTEIMVKEITGTNMPFMRELVVGLSEVFCLTDASAKDNPIIYASEEFYRVTQYGRDYVIGRNCRFLQGPKSNSQCVSRLRDALNVGQEICETLLNYRRDGSPFLNLLMCAPLYDNQGRVRYFLGAQVDVSGLVEEGRGLDSFDKLLVEQRAQAAAGYDDQSHELGSKKSLRALDELGQMLSLEEAAAVQRQARSESDAGSSTAGDDSRRGTMTSMRRGVDDSRRGTMTNMRRETSSRPPRRVLSDDSRDDEEMRAWSLSSVGPGGRLPGVYQNYLLVRPAPSLRIIFVSPALRIPGLLQSPFLSRVGGPVHIRDGLSEAFATGQAVTAKVTWMPAGRQHTENNADGRENGNYDVDGRESDGRRAERDYTPSVNGWRNGSGREGGKTRWISCTPLLGSDDRVGVWMVVMVENERVTGALPSRGHNSSHHLRPTGFPDGYANGNGYTNGDRNEETEEPEVARDRLRSPVRWMGNGHVTSGAAESGRGRMYDEDAGSMGVMGDQEVHERESGETGRGVEDAEA